MESSRTRNSILNMLANFIPNVITPIIGFFKFSFVVTYYGSNMNGLLQVFSHLLGFLQISEMGFGTAFGISLYLPLSKNDKKGVNKIYNSCNQFQKIIACVMFVGSLLSFTVIPYFLKGVHISVIYASALFFAFTLPYVIYQFFAAKYVLIKSMQKEYIFNKYYQFFVCLRMVISTACIPFVGFTSYILIDSMLYILAIYIAVKKIDPYLKPYIHETTQKDTTPIKATKFILFHRIASWVSLNTDNLVLSSSVYGVSSVSVYNSYMYIVNTIDMMIGGTLMACISSFGDLLVRKEISIIETFKKLFYVTMYISSVICISTFFGANDFVRVWINKADINYEQSLTVVFLIVILLYYRLSRKPLLIVLESQNLFHHTAFGAFLEACVNLGLSLLLVNQYGIMGVLIGTACAFYFIDFTIKGYYGMKLGIQYSVIKYFSVYVFLTLLALGLGYFIHFIEFFAVHNLLDFIIKMCIITSISSIVLFAVYYILFSEFRDTVKKLLQLGWKMIRRV